MMSVIPDVTANVMAKMMAISDDTIPPGRSLLGESVLNAAELPFLRFHPYGLLEEMLAEWDDQSGKYRNRPLFAVVSVG
jgi:hypothetical protein